MPLFTFNTGIPAAGNNPSVDQPDMQINNLSTNDILDIDHVTFNANNGGQHKQITFNIDPLQGFPFIPSIPTSPPVLFTQDDAFSLPQLFYYSGDVAHGANQYTLSQSGSTYLFGGIIIKWAQVPLPNGSTNNITFAGLGLADFPNSCFSVVVNIFASTVSPSNTDVLTVQANTFSKSGFSVAKSSATKITSITFIAIGN